MTRVGNTVTIGTPQDIGPSDSPTFASVTATAPIVDEKQVTTKEYVDAASAYGAGNGLLLSSKVFSLSAPVSVSNGGTGQTQTPADG